ncbi:hypothetical protein V6C11_13370 [Desulfotomaculum sp. 1211_IL3151]
MIKPPVTAFTYQGPWPLLCFSLILLTPTLFGRRLSTDAFGPHIK